MPKKPRDYDQIPVTAKANGWEQEWKNGWLKLTKDGVRDVILSFTYSGVLREGTVHTEFNRGFPFTTRTPNKAATVLAELGRETGDNR